MTQVYSVLVFHCIHLFPGKSSAGQVTGFSLHSSKLNDTVFIKVD